MPHLEVLLLVFFLLRASSHIAVQPQSMYLPRDLLDVTVAFGSMNASDGFTWVISSVAVLISLRCCAEKSRSTKER